MKAAVVAFWIAIALLLAGGAGGTARLVFPVVAVAMGLFLFVRARELYVDFVLWCWFLSPFLRRVMDWEAGWKEPSLVLLTPYVIALIAPFWDWRRLGSLETKSMLPFAGGAAAIGYGACLGLFLQPAPAMVASFVTWMTPVSFAWWYASTSDHDRERTCCSLRRSIVAGVIVMGIYGLIQFVLVPPWDANWLIQLGSITNVESMGRPEPYQLRVFSTLNSAGTYAIIVAAALLVLTSLRARLAAVGVAVGLASLLLTQVRSAWLGLGVGLLLLSMKVPKSVFRTLAIGLLGGLLTLPLLLNGPAGEAVRERFSSFTAISSDASASERTSGLMSAIGLFSENPLGFGLGVNEGVVANDGSYSLHDNGVVEVLLSLGFIAGPAYLGFLILLAFSKCSEQSSFAATCGVVALAVLSQLPLGSVFLGAPGFFLWLFAAIGAHGVGRADGLSVCHQGNSGARPYPPSGHLDNQVCWRQIFTVLRSPGWKCSKLQNPLDA